MNGKVLSLAVLLLAGAASGALAQDHSGPGGGGHGGGPSIQNGGPMYNAARQAQARGQGPQARPPQPPQAPHAQQPARPPEGSQQQHFRQDGHGPPSGWSRPEGARPPGGRPDGGRPDGGRPSDGRPDGGRPGAFAPPPGGFPGEAGRHDQHGGGGNPHAGGFGGWPQNGGGRGPDRPGVPDNVGHPNGGGRPPQTRSPDHRADDQWRQYERRPDWNRDHDHGRGNSPHWTPRRYPPVYNSPARYHGGYWRPPAGYYARAWRYGEVLPYGWYGADYQLVDWWDYDLPDPPPGYDWVRVGRDAMLVDYDGRIVQVVRLVFW